MSNTYKRSLFLCILLFFLSLGVPPFIARVSASTPIVQPSLAAQARTLYQAGRFAEAITAWQQAATAFATQGDVLNQAMALSNLSLTDQQLGHWDEAKQALTESLNLLEKQPHQQEQLQIFAQTLDIQGQMQLALGQSEDALKTWQQTTDIYTQIDNNNGIIQSQINQAQAMQNLGLYPKACKTLLDILKLGGQHCQISDKELKTLNNQSVEKTQATLQMLALRSLGNVLRVIGNGEHSQKVLEVSLKLAQQLEDSQNIAATYLSLGNTARTLANKETLKTSQSDEYRQTGLDYYNQAASLSPSPAIKLQAKLNQLSLLLETKNWSEAQALWPSLKSQISSLPASRTKAYAQINLAQSLMKLGTRKKAEETKGDTGTREGVDKGVGKEKNIDLLLSIPNSSEIDQILLTASQLAQSLGEQRAQSYALGDRGKLYELNQQWQQAEDFTKQALSIAPTYKAPDSAYQLFWQLGRIRKAQGDREGAIAGYTAAINTLKSLRSDLVTISSDVQFSFRESVEPVYRQLVDLLLPPTPGAEPSQQNLAQARQVIESLQLAELDNFFREACISVNPLQIDQVINSIDPRTAALYSVILPNRLEVILSLPKQPLRHYSVPIPQNQVEDTLVQLRQSISLENFPSKRRGSVARDLLGIVPLPGEELPTQNFLPAAQQIYDWLIRPAEPDLANSDVKTLVFVLDGALRNIPMAVLHDGKQYLIEKYSIALTPGLQVLDPKPIARQKLKTLAAGLSDVPEGSDFTKLPSVKAELEGITKQVPAQVLLNQSFTKLNFKTAINSLTFPVVHLATHGQFSSQAENTFILAWDDRINANEINSFLRADTRQTRPVELLVLSACETATGDKRAALGLAGVAVRAGARSTVASLWSVSDEATALLMTKFYQELVNHKVTKAEALRLAQLAVLQDQKLSLKHPYFWAAFVLVGNWL